MAFQLKDKSNYRHHSDEWSNLNDKVIKNSVVILKGFGDIHPYQGGPIFLAEKVFVHNCDKNFVYYWINQHTFPNMKELYLMSHPCEPCMLHCVNYITYLTNNYQSYKIRWASNNDKVIVVDHSKMEADMDSYGKEEIMLESKE